MLFKKYPFWDVHKRSRKYINDPAKAKEQYIQYSSECMSKAEQVRSNVVHGHDGNSGSIIDNIRTLGRKNNNETGGSGNNGTGGGLRQYAEDLMAPLLPLFTDELAALTYAVLPAFGKLDKGRREGKTKEIRDEYETLCGGYEGDPLMEENIAMYKLARSLPESIWSEYDHSNFVSTPILKMATNTMIYLSNS